jgi:NitT/TauT family transport system permease protein
MRGAVVLSGKNNPKSKIQNLKSESGWLRLVPLLGIMGFLLMWHLLSLRYAAFILPGPLDVLQKLGEKLRDGTLPLHIGVTLSAALPGLLIGTALAFAFGYPIAKSRLADRLLSPFIIASQGIPFVAIAPLLFIWFGTGLGSKLIVCALIVFFPITINVITGIRSVPALWHDLFSAHRASPWQRFIKLELPAALPFVFAGLRVGGTLSMIGAITSEFISASDRGLGFLVNQGTGLYDTPLVMLAVVLIVCIALAIYGCVRLIERVVIRD